MTAEFERERARLVVATTARLRDELKVGVAEACSLGVLTPERMRTMDAANRRVLLAFLKRFENAVEAGRRLFRVSLVAVAEDVFDLSTLAILEGAEREGVLASAEGWRDVMRMRNKVAHEYAMTPEEAAAALVNALEAAQAAVELLDGALLAITRPPFAMWLSKVSP